MSPAHLTQLRAQLQISKFRHLCNMILPEPDTGFVSKKCEGDLVLVTTWKRGRALPKAKRQSIPRHD